MKENLNVEYEFILINDGSPDDTWKTIVEIVNENSNLNIRGLNYLKNGGKGYAVRSGLKYVLGDYALMLDADGATDVNEIPKILSIAQKHPNSIVIGSRNVIAEKADRPFYRRLPSLVNNFIVQNVIGISGIKDTQCGFKIFTKDLSKLLSSNLHLNRWAFDVELLYILQKHNVNIIEMPVNWKEVDGGNLFVLQATISFFRDYFAIFWLYFFKIWN